MLPVLNRGEHQKDWSDERHGAFVRECAVYITGLQRAGRLHAAQPLAKQGAILAGAPDQWSEFGRCRRGRAALEWRPAESKGDGDRADLHVFNHGVGRGRALYARRPSLGN